MCSDDAHNDYAVCCFESCYAATATRMVYAMCVVCGFCSTAAIYCCCCVLLGRATAAAIAVTMVCDESVMDVVQVSICIQRGRMGYGRSLAHVAAAGLSGFVQVPRMLVVATL